MRRTYDRERYLDRVALIREHVPDCALTTDIIVGFPGETEADFAETLEVVEEVGFDGAFTFIYSPRRDTEAAEFVDDFVDHEVAGRAHGAPRRGRPAPRPRARPALRRPHARRARRGHLAPRPVAPARPHDATTRSSTSTASRAPGEIVPVEITAATSQTLSGSESLLSRAAERRVLYVPRRASTRRCVARSVRPRLCEHMFVRWASQNVDADDAGRLPGLGDTVVRRFDAPEALTSASTRSAPSRR